MDRGCGWFDRRREGEREGLMDGGMDDCDTKQPSFASFDSRATRRDASEILIGNRVLCLLTLRGGENCTVVDALPELMAQAV